ncbi:gluconate 2-dehydrogenase subunit 3 family protein [Algoriphagus halophytocola]|uniref:Gluconate 2-dehydrogenase subunit 3 family protein n=1 Tax=Algoriphagus halophytocola TaxID=2991499 RepID=A0ABY6MQ45_9BACT|nr:MULTISPECIES: gluconate 2-dehydrogenase subunit 3 family protein [unclassified Algoriphagus]UZD24639.1 gluconate 2-dehydrogenase subunit 3 family protein [Algoriphagus sp. TR-M5]WBL42007.1 gluconate 2-dehydrogenase subunit 3 family protein [Algoriphagus sp. TR-M9]
MNRRENLKLLFTGSLGAGMLMTGCEPEQTSLAHEPIIGGGGTPGNRTEAEKIRDAELLAENFFTDEERKKVDTLADIICPADEESPAATALKVTDFIDFMMNDQPGNQTRMRGGLMWLDFEANEKFGKPFNELSQDQVIAIVDLVAWPDKATPEYEGAVRWFNMLRNLVCSGYFSTQAGWDYIGYLGNRPNAWDGVPQNVMDKHGFKLEEKYIPIYLKPEDRGTIAQWDDEGNLIG